MYGSSHRKGSERAKPWRCADRKRAGGVGSGEGLGWDHLTVVAMGFMLE